MPRQPNNHTLPDPLVVKLGGSLERFVPALVEVFQQQTCPLLIVPGGGRFADAVREQVLGDDEAHWTAIRAMDRYGSLIAAQGLPTTDRIVSPSQPSVLLPYHCFRQYDPLPHTWDITSDTISAWVAGRLKADLLVLKSVDGIPAGGRTETVIVQNVDTGIVDPCFIPYILNHGIRATIINGTLPDRVAAFLRGEAVPAPGFVQLIKGTKRNIIRIRGGA